MTLSGDRIERLELFHVDIPLPTPFYPIWIPGYPETHRRYTLLRVTTHHGLIGHATGLAFDRERDGLGEFIGRFLVGLDPTDAPAAADRARRASIRAQACSSSLLSSPSLSSLSLSRSMLSSLSSLCFSSVFLSVIASLTLLAGSVILALG